MIPKGNGKHWDISMQWKPAIRFVLLKDSLGRLQPCNIIYAISSFNSVFRNYIYCVSSARNLSQRTIWALMCKRIYIFESPLSVTVAIFAPKNALCDSLSRFRGAEVCSPSKCCRRPRVTSRDRACVLQVSCRERARQARKAPGSRVCDTQVLSCMFTSHFVILCFTSLLLLPSWLSYEAPYSHMPDTCA